MHQTNSIVSKVSILIMLIFFTVAAYAESMLGDDFSFQAPDGWGIKLTKSGSDSLGTQYSYFVYDIPCECPPNHAPIALISAKQYKSITDLRNYIRDEVYEDNDSFFFNRRADGEGWEILMHRSNTKIQYSIIDLVGVSETTLAHVRVILPMVQETSGKWLDKEVNNFNRLFGSATLKGKKHKISARLSHSNNSIVLDR